MSVGFISILEKYARSASSYGKLVFGDEEIDYESFFDRIERRSDELRGEKSIIHKETGPISYLVDLFVAVKTRKVFCPLGRYISQDECDKRKSFLEKIPVVANEFCAVFWTSGTTSASRAVLHSERNLFKNAETAAFYQSFTSETKIFANLTLSHVGGLGMQVLPALLKGASIYFSPSRRGLELLDSRQSFDTAVLVPQQIRDLLKREKQHLLTKERVRTILTGSSVVGEDVFRELKSREIKCLNVYGLTEIGPFVCTSDSYDNDSESALCSLGTPVPEYQVEILEGEVCLGGQCIGTQCVEDEDGVKLFHPSKVKTGDGGYLKQGKLYYTGRLKQRVNIGGYKLDPEEIEQFLLQCSGVEECVVYGHQDKKGRDVLVCCFKGDGEVRTLKRKMLSKFPLYALPRIWRNVEQLPKTELEKISYREID